VLSLVAETVKSDVPSGNSAKTTILALLGVEFAVNVSDMRVIVLFIDCAVNERYIPPSPPYSEVEPGLPCSAVDAGIKGCAVGGKVGTNDVYAGPSAG